MRFFLICSFVLFSATFALARIINVPAEYATIQAGIDASQNGDTVLVAPGEYEGDFTINGCNILLTSSHGPDTTFVRGTCSLQTGIDSTCIIRGLTFLRQGFDVSSQVIVYPNVDPKIEGNVFEGNTSAQGGGIYSYGGKPIIRSNIIKNNYARAAGGGIYLGNPFFTSLYAEVSYNIISGNRTGFSTYGDGYGGGLYLLVDAIVKYNIIHDNRAEEPNVGGYGGGIDREQSSGDQEFKTVITNNTIVFNTAKEGGMHGHGGGLFINSANTQDSLIIKNNIIAFNSWGGNVRRPIDDSCFLEWDYNLIYGDTAMGFPHGEHDIFLDPKFVDTLTDDYHLLADSPCIDAGDPEMPLDPDSTRADIGAYFFDQTVDVSDPSDPIGPFDLQLFQNYPNPFNSSTVISYELDTPSLVKLQIFSITGQLIKSLIHNQSQLSGEHRIIWDSKDQTGKEVATGIYIYRLSVDDVSVARAMITIR